MALPVILAGIGLGGLAVSTGSNLYAQYNQRKLYRKQENAYRNLHNGYQRYLSQNGREINPDRAWTSYFGKAELARNNLENSYVGSVGTLSGAIGAGAIGIKSSGLFGSSVGKTSKRL